MTESLLGATAGSGGRFRRYLSKGGTGKYSDYASVPANIGV